MKAYVAGSANGRLANCLDDMVINYRKHSAQGLEASDPNVKVVDFIAKRDGRGNGHATASLDKSFDALAAVVLSKAGTAELDALLAESGIEKERYCKWKRGVKLQIDGETLLKAKLGDEKAMEKVLDDNMGLVRRVTWSMKGATKNLELEDLIQEGSLGLLRAVVLFDFERETRFSTYAMYWIRRNIERAIENSSIIRLPSYVHQSIEKMNKANSILRADKGKPAFEELEEKTSMTQSKIEDLLSLKRDIVSLDVKNECGKDPIVDSIAAQGPGVEQQYIYKESNEKFRKDLENAMLMLDAREVCAVRMRSFMRYPNPKNDFEKGANEVIENVMRRIELLEHVKNPDMKLMPMEEIGAYLHITRERARQIISKAYKKLKPPLQEYG